MGFKFGAMPDGNCILAGCVAALTKVHEFFHHGCFVAGTLVHTKDGLRPIEEIQEGDWVLSKPENGHGEQTYKRVVRTTRFESKPVVRVSYYPVNYPESDLHYFIVTPDHPFWVVGYDEGSQPYNWDGHSRLGWMQADHLWYGTHILLANGDLAIVSAVDTIWRMHTKDQGWIAVNRDSYNGYLIDLRKGQTPKDQWPWVMNDFQDEDGFLDRNDDEIADDWVYKTRVYNFEVEDFHTYYVGELGVWVHNANCLHLFPNTALEQAKPWK